jgi:hypothetical protein
MLIEHRIDVLENDQRRDLLLTTQLAFGNTRRDLVDGHVAGVAAIERSASTSPSSVGGGAPELPTAVEQLASGQQ